jgi:hypothetical protein
MALQNRQGGFDPYTPQKPPDALGLLYEVSGGKDMSQAYNAYQRGEYLPAFGQGAWGAAQAASLAYPALKAGGAALRGAAPLAREAAGAIPALMRDETGAIRAWHASPYDFEKFDLGKVGTGQGAQSYGHGIYAAESPAVSGKGGQYDLEFTAKNLGKYDLNPGELLIHRMLRADRSDMDILGELARGGGYTFDEAASALDRVKAAKAKIYEVDIHADPKAFLASDVPMQAQSDLVQQALERAGAAKGVLSSSDPASVFVRRAAENRYQAADLFNRGEGELSLTPLDVSQKLNQAGVPGIKYFDEFSRSLPETNYFIETTTPSGRVTRGQPYGDLETVQQTIENFKARGYPDTFRVVSEPVKRTSNYVMFDPSLVEIRRKYGILPPLAAGGLLGAAEE